MQTASRCAQFAPYRTSRTPFSKLAPTKGVAKWFEPLLLDNILLRRVLTPHLGLESLRGYRCWSFIVNSGMSFITNMLCLLLACGIAGVLLRCGCVRREKKGAVGVVRTAGRMRVGGR